MGNVLSKPDFYTSDLEKEHICKKRKITHHGNIDGKVRKTKMQEEFGPKKFIKP